ncbi:hypothetical protein CKO36_10125 [Rhabdochromatium marinum]|nr:ATP-binding protein [Rhabdochromatium marinum]MBK1648948.1 hypothetical protein [Rhabdochromatium marinum]
MRFFNTEGPIQLDKHYCLPPLQRWALEDILRLIEQEKYFLLHAPRQTGKTSCLLTLMEYLNRDGRYRAVYAKRDYRIHARSEVAPITGDSAFNIKAESLRLGDFTAAETHALLQEHTEETGQVFTPEALEHVWTLTQGQPWLVNALAYETCFRRPEGRDRSRPIDIKLIEQAKEHLIQHRVTHLDQLADKLSGARVRHIIEPMLAGEALEQLPLHDLEYLIDLGLLRQPDGGGIEIANPIYREVLPRTLALVPQASLPRITPSWLDDQGQLNPERLLKAFLAFWRQHGEPLLRSAPYAEIAPHLVLMAFLHRVVNGGGTLEREYAIGSRRMDLCLRYGAVTLGIELKVWRDGRPDPLAQGLMQLDGYLAGLELNSGWLVIFDRRSGQPPIETRTQVAEARTPNDRAVRVIRA